MSALSTWLLSKSFSARTKVVFCVFVLTLLFSANSYGELMCSDTQATTDTGSLFDPGGTDGQYSNNQNCGFLIQPSGGGDITLSFSSFNYEYYYDTLKIYAGTDANGTLLGSFTGSSLPSQVVSTVGSLYIVHTTDYSETEAGFAASWSTVAPIPGENRLCRDAGSSLSDGQVTDPGGASANYSNDQDCGFLIQPTGGGDITLSFSSFNYEYYFDTLKVYAGTDANGTLLASFTGSSLPSQVVSTVGSLYIVHSTDYSETEAGFVASWSTVAPIPGENRLCRDAGSTLSDGQLSDPGGASANYSNDQDCGFLIQPTGGGDITLTFSSFDYEYFYDDLRIYDGTSSSAKRIGKFTGTNLPASITATSGAMYVVHDTDYSVTRSGFIATWNTAPADPNDHRLCRDSVSNDNSGNLSDSGGPLAKYANDEDCSFLIQPTDSGDITLSFSEFDYENSYDYLTVYDGSSSAGIALGTFTGTTLPLALVASSGAMYIVHETDYSVIKDGFDASWSVSTTTPELDGCAVAFPDGLSSHGTGQITFGDNAQLIGSPDNLLAASSLTENDGSSLTTCNTANCSLDPNGVLESISPGAFQTTASTEDVSVASEGSATLGTSGNEYRSVTSNNLASINFSASHDEYKINSLQLGSEAVLNLNANTVYWLNSFTMSSQAVINVVGSGTATLIVNSSLQFTSPVLVNSPAINSSGDASKLALYVFGDIVLNSQSTVSGLVYAQGSLTLISASYIFGAATADNISLNSESVVTYQSSEVIAAELGALCADETGVDHYQIEFVGDGITCEAKQMTIYACADETCDSLYDQPASIDLSPMGWIDGNGVVTDTIDFSSLTTISLSHTTAETIVISSSGANPSADLNCNDGGLGSCDLTFANAVIEFFGNDIDEPILDQLAEQEFGVDEFGNVNLRAVKADKGVCVAALTGSNTVNLSYDCSDPVSCEAPLRFNVTNLSENTPSAVSVTFNNEGIAAFSTANASALSYADAGMISLSADAVVDGATITTAAVDVNVYPDRLVLSSTSANTPNYAAGKNFDFSIQALGANNTVLKNYQPGQLQLALQRITPSAESAAEGAFYYANGQSIGSKLTATVADITSLPFSDGTYLYSEAYLTEVGSFSLHAQDANYLGHIISGETVTEDTSLNLGTFIPAFFAVEKNTPSLLDTCDSFSYVGQTFMFMVDPALILSAKNHRGDITNNYSDALWKFLPIPADVLASGNLEYTDNSGLASIDDEGVIVGTDKGTAKISDNQSFNGQGILAINDIVLAYIKAPTAINSFNPSVNMTFGAGFIQDSDGVCYQENYPTSGCSEFTIPDIHIPNIVEGEPPHMRYGRLALLNTYGPETEPLKVTVRAEYFNDSMWQFNPDDSCSAIDWNESNGDLLLTRISGDTNILDNIDNVTSNGFLANGLNEEDDDLELDKSGFGPGVMGEIKLELAPAAFDSYLNFDWNGDGLIDSSDKPAAMINFGLYRGNDRVINWQEVFK